MLSEEILQQRAGNFCASENHRLMTNWDSNLISRDYPEFNELHYLMRDLEKKPLVQELKDLASCKVTGALIHRTWSIINEDKPPQGLVTYAQEKATELLFDVDPSLNFETVHTQNGAEREADCIAILEEKTGLKFSNTGDDQIHLSVDSIGCTPDGILYDECNLIATGAEVKCKSPTVHAKNMLIKDNADMIKYAFEAFTQVQTAMLVTDTQKWYYANYNPYARDESLAFGFIIVERDEHFIAKLKERVAVAKTIRNDFLGKLKQE